MKSTYGSGLEQKQLKKEYKGEKASVVIKENAQMQLFLNCLMPNLWQVG